MRQSLWYRVYDIIRPLRWRLSIALATLLLLTAIGLYMPVWAARLIDPALVQKDGDLFLRCVTTLLVLHVSSSLFSYLYSFQVRVLGGRLIFDLRGNGGGYLQEAVKIADLFLPKDRVVVYTAGRAFQDTAWYKTEEDALIGDAPMIVLVDRGSASASEIVSGAS